MWHCRTLQRVAQRHGPRHRSLAAAATSKQKRALDPSQLQGSSSTVQAAASTGGETGNGGGGSTDSNQSMIMAGVGVVALLGGGALYFTSRGGSGNKQIDANAPSTLTPADAGPRRAPPLASSDGKNANQQAKEEEPGHRVVSISVPLKMKNAHSASSKQTDETFHPIGGNRVHLIPTATERTVPAKSLQHGDTSLTDTALATLQASSRQAAAESVIQSHQSAWSSATTTNASEVLADLETLTPAQLQTRVVQLAMELQERTKWEAVRLKEFLAMKEKETAEKYLEILQKQRLEFEDLLAKRLREQEHVLAQQYGQALNEKDESIQKVMDTALEAQKRQHEQEKKAFEAAKAVELKIALDEEYGKQMEKFKQEVAKELEHKLNMLQVLAKKLRELESSMGSIKSSQRGSLKAHRLSAASLALAEKLETNQPATAELKALKVAVGRDPGVIATALSTIPESAMVAGVPTVSELQAQFQQVQKRARQAAFVPKGRTGLEGQLAGMLFATLTFPPDADDAAPDDDKDNAQYVLVRANKHVQSGDLAQAVEQLDKLSGQAAFTVADWKINALHRIAVEKALKVIKMECALVNESLAD